MASRWPPDEAPTADAGSGTHSHWPSHQHRGTIEASDRLMLSGHYAFKLPFFWQPVYHSPPPPPPPSHARRLYHCARRWTRHAPCVAFWRPSACSASRPTVHFLVVRVTVSHIHTHTHARTHARTHAHTHTPHVDLQGGNFYNNSPGSAGLGSAGLGSASMIIIVLSFLPVIVRPQALIISPQRYMYMSAHSNLTILGIVGACTSVCASERSRIIDQNIHACMTLCTALAKQSSSLQ